MGIHAQPYNFHDAGHLDANGIRRGGPAIDNTTGTLKFDYQWQSTSGRLTDIDGNTCKVYEYVTYDSNSQGSYGTQNGVNYYLPPSPPVGYMNNDPAQRFAYANPYISPNPTGTPPGAPGSAGELLDYQNPPPWPSHCSGPAATWTAVQNYYFDDTATKEVKVKVPGPDSGANTIVRTVSKKFSTGDIWKYTVTKSGYEATATLP